jgi:hypothetical protein
MIVTQGQTNHAAILHHRMQLVLGLEGLINKGKGRPLGGLFRAQYLAG